MRAHTATGSQANAELHRSTGNFDGTTANEANLFQQPWKSDASSDPWSKVGARSPVSQQPNGSEINPYDCETPIVLALSGNR